MKSALKKLLDNYRLAAATEREKGTYFEELILLANQVRGPARMEYLQLADGKLVCLRGLLRYSYDLNLLAGTQIKFAADYFDQLGRLLGAWLKGTDR